MINHVFLYHSLISLQMSTNPKNKPNPAMQYFFPTFALHIRYKAQIVRAFLPGILKDMVLTEGKEVYNNAETKTLYRNLWLPDERGRQ